MTSISALVIILFMATFTEWVVERVVAPWIKGKWLILVSTAVGVGLCLAYQLDLVCSLMKVTPTIWGQIITGALVGAGSDVAHGFIKKFSLRK